MCPNFSKFLHFFGDLVLQILSVHHIVDMDLLRLRSLRPSQALWAHNLWRMFCAGFRHSACFHARVVLDSVAFRLVVLVKVDDALCVLGVDIVLSRLQCVFWCRGRKKSER